MSGSEWTPEHSDAPVDGRPPLSVEVGADGSIPPSPTPLLGVNPFGAKRVKGFDPSQVDQDDAEAEANRLDDEAATGQPGKLAALVEAIRSAVVGLLHRRSQADHPGVDPDPTADQPPGDPNSDSDLNSDEETAKPPRRWAPSAWTWETRVGVAAVTSFLILVGVFVVNKGWVGQSRSPILSVGNPASGAKADDTQPAKPEDSTKLARAGTKPKSLKPPKPSTTSPPLPDTAPGVADAESGTGAEAQHAPNLPPNTSAGSLASELLPPGGPTTKPDTGESPLAAMPGSDLTQASAGDTSKPPELPTPTSDAPPLPNDPVAGNLPPTSTPATPPTTPPTPVASTQVKPEAQTKPNLTGDPPTPVVEEQPAQVTVTPTPQPEPEPASTPPGKPGETPAPVQVATTEPAAPPASEPKRAEAAPPQPARPPSSLEAVPASATGGSAAAMGPGWVEIPSGGKRPGVGPSSDGATLDSASGVDSPTTARGGDGPAIVDDPAPSDSGGGPVLHTVGPGENFWTISKDYYNSHRYYKALHKANAGQVPDITKLYVGTVIRIPPPEALDRSLVEPPTLGASNDGPTVSRTSSTTKNADPGAELAPTRTTRPGLRRARNDPVEEPRRPIYKVKANDTLRSIARDTLSDSKRAGEIFNLNRDILGDPKAALATGTSLTLPEDAVIGRRTR